MSVIMPLDRRCEQTATYRELKELTHGRRFSSSPVGRLIAIWPISGEINQQDSPVAHVLVMQLTVGCSDSAQRIWSYLVRSTERAESWMHQAREENGLQAEFRPPRHEIKISRCST